MAQSTQNPIPPELLKQLQEFRRHLWRTKLMEAVLAGFFGLLLSFLLVFGLDRAFATPGWLRLAILLAGTSLFAGFAPYWLHRWIFKHRRDNQIARLISKKFPRLGDRLLGVLELANQKESEASLSPALRDAATRDVARVAAERDFAQALPKNRNALGMAVVTMLFALTGLAFVILPKAGLNAFQRWLMPLSDTPRYTLTKFERLPKTLVVPLGEPFTLDVKLASDSESKPGSAKARYTLQNWLEVPRREGLYRFEFPAQQREGDITLAAGDARASIHVIPTLPPTLESINSTIIYPSYLQLTDRVIDIRAGTLSILEGSEVQLQATGSRELTGGEMRLKDYNSSNIVNDAPSVSRWDATAVGNRLTYPKVRMEKQPLELEMDWADKLGLKSRDTFRLRLEPMADEVPSVYVQGSERQVAILPEETIEFEARAGDDFGLKTLGLEWSGEFTSPSAGSPARGEIELEAGRPDARDLISPVAFSPAIYEIAPQKLTLRAFTEDYLPERGRVYSQPIVLYILTRDEHAQMLKDRFDRIIGELEDVSRKEQAQLDENQRLERLDPNDLKTPENQDKLENQRAAEQENVERMEELSERMEKVFEDALRNGEMDKETMKRLSETQRRMRELSEKDLPEVEKKLEEAQDQRSTPEQSQKDLQEAVEEQKEAVEKMRETLEKANEANQNMEESTFVNRLKKAASEHDSTSDILADSLNDLVGRNPETLDPAVQRVLGETELQLKRTSSDVRWIQEDLGHLLARTQKEIHQKLLQAMQESNVNAGMEANRQRLSKNLTFKGIVFSKEWAGKFREWAKMLEDARNEAGGGEGGGESIEDQDFEFMLKVMRMIQTEQDIRARTRALEQLRRSQRPAPNLQQLP